MGIAGSHACGLVEFAWEGSDTKRMHLGRASQLGMESAFLAQAGFTGPSRIIEGRFGFYNAFSLPGADLNGDYAPQAWRWPRWLGTLDT